MKVLYDEIFLKIEFDNSNQWLITTWRGYQTMESIMQGGNAMIEAVKTNSCGKILNDNRQVKGSWFFAAKWITNKWTPEIISAGLKKMAWILSPDEMSQYSVDQSTDSSFSDTIVVFEIYDEAVQWLKQA